MFEGTWSKVSNKADWIDCIELLDQETGDPLDLSGLLEIVVQISYPAMMDNNPLYGIYPGGGSNFIGAVARLSDGTVAHVQTGIFQFTFPVSVMRALPPQVYNMGISLTSADGTVSQFFVGQVPVQEGYVLTGSPVI